MSENSDNKRSDNADPAPVAAARQAVQTSSERWVRYGTNVIAASILVIVLAGIIVWGAQKYAGRRLDWTADNTQSLKPQTVAVIQDVKSPVKIVSLYPRLRQEGAAGELQEDTYRRVVDTLDEYRSKGNNITVEVIDPVAEPMKVDQWLGEVTRKYGGNVKAYRDLLTEFPKTLEQIKKLADAEVKKISALPDDMQFESEEQMVGLRAAFNTVAGFPQLLQVIDEQVQEELKEKIPDYKGSVQNLEVMLGQLSRNNEAIRKLMEELRDDEKAPAPAREYAKSSLPAFAEMKKQADAVLEKIKTLGELKLDDVRRRLVAPEGEAPPPAIAVMGESDIRLIDARDVWRSGQSTGLVAAGTSDAEPKLRFAGEQRLTAAILALSTPQKPKIVFVRGGGPAKTDAMMGEGQYSEIAERLRALNFDVLEKDISGQAAQAAMMRQMPPPQEASDEDLKNAIWVVFSEPMMHPQFGMMPGGNPELGNKLKEHLDRGGSALCLFNIEGDPLATPLAEWGIQARPNMMALHEPIKAGTGGAEDFIEVARRQPYIFVINEYGGPHPITSTLQSLDAALLPMFPVTKTATVPADVTVTQLLPVPTQLTTWGESDLSFLMRRGAPAPSYDEKSGDLPPPLWAGAAAERQGKGRLVVLGSAEFISNTMLSIPDPKLSQSRLDVARFPGNGELFTNSILWLAKQEKMIALSPAALDTARIRPMSAGTLAFWRVGVLLIGFPLLALFCGLMVYRARANES